MPENKTSRSVKATINRQRRVQKQVELADQRSARNAQPKRKKPAQTGKQAYPENPLPRQHLRKGGLESSLKPAPAFLAPAYRGSGKLENKVALITGGDSGIGRAVAVLFAREGADVAVVYLNEHSDAKLTRRHIANEGRQCLLLSGDVKDPAFCRSAVEKTIARFGKLDVLVNNAAFQQHSQTLEGLSETHFDETIRTNIYGYFHMAKAAVSHLGKGAAIINTGSETGLFGHGSLIDYATTKGAIHAFTKSLASNLLPRGIRVNAVAPGPVWTPLNPSDKSAKEITQFGHKTEMKRPAQPEEISPAYVFLASETCSSYITGIVLPILGSVGES